MNIIKKTFIFTWFLRIRSTFFNNEKLISQLLKRAHLLDKLNQDKKSISYIRKEVEFCLNQISKKNIRVNDAISWAIDVLQKSRFNFEKQNVLSDEENVCQKYLVFSDFENIIKSRRSVRSWTNEKVENEIVLEAINCAQWAPSSCNRQPWYYLVLSKKEDIQILKKITNQTFFENADKIIVCFFNSRFYNNTEYSYVFLDMGMSIQNLLLAFHTLNIGACCFGIKQVKEYENYFKEINNRFNLSVTMRPVAFIAIGKYKLAPIAPGRKNIDEISKFI